MEHFSNLAAILLSLAIIACLSASTATAADDDESASKSKAARASGLSWLVDQQGDEGFFKNHNGEDDVATTAICGLALLANGGTPSKGPHNRAIAKALDAVLSQQKDGYFGDRAAGRGAMYAHAFTTRFLAECPVADSKVMAVREKVEEPLEGAVAVIVRSQNELGWRYLPRKMPADVTCTSCQVMALSTARATGVKNPPSTFDDATSFLLGCQNEDVGFRYMASTSGSNIPRTASCM